MFEIENAPHDDWTVVFGSLVAHLPEADRTARIMHFLDLINRGILDPNGIFVARSEGEIVGTQVCVPLPGAACLFWLPPRNSPAANALIAAGLAWCRTRGCKIAQALARPEERSAAAPFEWAGFRHITRLLVWERNLENLPAKHQSNLRYESYRPHRAAEFAAVIDRTYLGTLDCPELNGVRTIDEILAGHQGQGRFHPDFWWLAFDSSIPVGVVLLVEMPDAATWELAYLGVVPEFRGRGFARAMLMDALHALHGEFAARVLLAVDQRNAPAQRLYQSVGFFPQEENEVFLYVF